MHRSGRRLAVAAAVLLCTLCRSGVGRRMLVMLVIHTRLTELGRNSYTFSFRTGRFVWSQAQARQCSLLQAPQKTSRRRRSALRARCNDTFKVADDIFKSRATTTFNSPLRSIRLRISAYRGLIEANKPSKQEQTARSQSRRGLATDAAESISAERRSTFRRSTARWRKLSAIACRKMR